MDDILFDIYDDTHLNNNGLDLLQMKNIFFICAVCMHIYHAPPYLYKFYVVLRQKQNHVMVCDNSIVSSSFLRTSPLSLHHLYNNGKKHEQNATVHVTITNANRNVTPILVS